MTSRPKTGGGINSKQRVDVGVRNGRRAREERPRGVSQIGSAMGNHAMGKGGNLRGAVEPVRGARQQAGGPGGVPLGNEVALNVGKGGPGAGRTLYGQCGTQGQHGAPDRGMPGLPSTKGQWPD